MILLHTHTHTHTHTYKTLIVITPTAKHEFNVVLVLYYIPKKYVKKSRTIFEELLPFTISTHLRYVALNVAPTSQRVSMLVLLRYQTQNKNLLARVTWYRYEVSQKLEYWCKTHGGRRPTVTANRTPLNNKNIQPQISTCTLFSLQSVSKNSMTVLYQRLWYETNTGIYACAAEQLLLRIHLEFPL